MRTNPAYPATPKTEACVITNAGDTVNWFDSTRDAAIFAAGYAGQYGRRYAMFVTADHDTTRGRYIVTFDCSF